MSDAKKAVPRVSSMRKKRKPKFRRPNYGRTKRKRVKDNWVKPRGMDTAQRKQLQEAGNLPKVGYRNDKRIRDLHPSGKLEVLIANLKDLEELDSTVVVRIRKGVGALKRSSIVSAALSKGIRVLNE